MNRGQAAEWSKRVREIEELVVGHHDKQALQEAGSVLEALLKDLYRRTIDSVAPDDQKQITDKVSAIGKGNQSVI